MASVAQLAERSAVNRQVPGSIPGGGAFFISGGDRVEAGLWLMITDGHYW